jgi:Reverse transcriptase (RNA-dependent DNA polymerase)
VNVSPAISRYAGQLSKYINIWESEIKDNYVNNIIIGYKIEFIRQPFQNHEYCSIFTKAEESKVELCIDRLLHIGAIKKVKDVQNQFVSRVFTVPKSDNSCRLILNLKQLNEFIQYEHFQMEDYRSVCNILSKGMFAGTIDLKDAYHLVPIHEESRKYLRFRFRDQLYEYTCLPFGLASAPRVFTKIMRPIVGHLRKKGHLIIIFLDDILVINNSKALCEKSINSCRCLLQSLGFIISEKSQLIPNTRIKYLGFIFDSNNMTLELTPNKRQKILNLCGKAVNKKYTSIQELAELIGNLISASPAISYGLLYTRQLEFEKARALEVNDNDFSKSLTLSKVALEDLEWWIKHLPLGFNFIRSDSFDITIFSDSSMTGWGGHVHNERARGFWTLAQQKLHINELELLAIENVLYSFQKYCTGKNVLLRTDSTVAIAYINKYGGCRAPHLHIIAKRLYKWIEYNNMYIFASYINSKDNYIADSESRAEIDDSDWQLDTNIFKHICNVFNYKPTVDLFATHLTSQCEVFGSWFPDPQSTFVDAFTISWSDLAFYAFPPFCLVARMLRKLINDRAEGLVVVPYWPTQVWFPIFQSLAQTNIIIMEPSDSLLKSYFISSPHPLAKTLKISAAILSAKHSSAEDFRRV